MSRLSGTITLKQDNEGSEAPKGAGLQIRIGGCGSPLRISPTGEGGAEGGSPLGAPPRRLRRRPNATAQLQMRASWDVVFDGNYPPPPVPVQRAPRETGHHAGRALSRSRPGAGWTRPARGNRSRSTSRTVSRRRPSMRAIGPDLTSFRVCAIMPPLDGEAEMARVKPVSQLTAKQFDTMFPNEDACKTYLDSRRWPEGIHCPRCGNCDVYPVTNRPFHWQCSKCATAGGYRFSVLVGTIFENTNKPLQRLVPVSSTLC